MALATTHDSTNRQQEELPKTVKLLVSARALGGGYLELVYNQVYTERFRYVGMSAEAAATCQAAMVALYTETVNGVNQCVADVSAPRQDGHMWQVIVSVMRSSIITETQAPA